jgi:hypothetical protein
MNHWTRWLPILLAYADLLLLIAVLLAVWWMA